MTYVLECAQCSVGLASPIDANGSLPDLNAQFFVCAATLVKSVSDVYMSESRGASVEGG